MHRLTERFSCNMERGNLRFVVLIIVYVFYLVIGAAIFSSIEGPFEKRVVSDVRSKRDAFLAKYPCVNDLDLEEFIKVVVRARDQGISPMRNVTIPSWEFGSAFFFAGTVITTIGKSVSIPFDRIVRRTSDWLTRYGSLLFVFESKTCF